jgi:integrase
MQKHSLMGGKLHVYKRPGSSHWQCSTYLNGRNWRNSTKEESLSHAKEIAEDWYLELKGKSRAGLIKKPEKRFQMAADLFLQEYDAITEGERSPQYVAIMKLTLRAHVLPYFGPKGISEVTSGAGQAYRIHRMTSRKHPKTGEPLRPSRSTLHKEFVIIRQIMKAAHRHGWIEYVPDFSPPYKMSGKVGHRAWFSPEEYTQLYTATRARAKQPSTKRWQWESEQLHDFVLFMANTGLRPDEAARLEYRDVKIVRDLGSNETILEIEVRGKRGVGHCKSTTRAVRPFLRLRKRNSPQPTDRLFPITHRELLNTILAELNLKFDRDGKRRTAYSLRHTYICFRLTEGADIYQIAKNCRTSVEMIEKHYAIHLKNTLDAAAINVLKPKPHRKPRPLSQEV